MGHTTHAVLVALAGLFGVSSSHSGAMAPTPDELLMASRWTRARFQDAAESADARAGLVVLANYGDVQKNARGSAPLRLAGREHARGLYCHAPSRLLVRLPAPGKTFSAIAGVDSNDQTSGGRGSVEFQLEVDGEARFRSGMLRENSPPADVRVELNGAREFILSIHETADGISCDQADWADAKVALEDGRELWLADLPLDNAAAQWLSATDMPFSFSYGGKPSRELTPAWTIRRTARVLDERRTGRTLVVTDPASGLEVRCEAVAYHDFATVEWTLHLKNTGREDTPVISDLLPLDLRVDRPPGGEFTLHHHTGDDCSPTSYQPHETILPSNADRTFAPAGGRPSSAAFPYFNLEWPREGLVVVVGWPGQWSARFTRDADRTLHVCAGQELTRFKLRPGEEIRTPLIVLQFWQGDRLRAQNLWRRWMVAHNLPRDAKGKTPAPMLSSCSGGFFPGLKCNEADEFRFIKAFALAGIRLDYWWMDAGWYPCDAWPAVGTWSPDPERFPRGLKAVSDQAHDKGMGLIVWFEPERVTPGSWLYEKHPDWLLGRDGETKLLNLGIDAARGWLTDHVDKLLTEQGIDLYRQDFNIDPLGFWRADDPPDRQGITEIRHVEGYLAYWDELRRRHPGLLIDSCASGGRRNDLETLRRAVPLLRSDFQSFAGDPAYAPGNQGHTYGLSSWIPYYGQGVYFSRQAFLYSARSYLSPAMGIAADVRTDGIDWPALRQFTEQWRQAAPLMLGDFYPLTPYRTEDDLWMAWQFDVPESGEGLVQAFRRASSPYEAARFRLRGLEPAGRYRVVNLDAPAAVHDYSGEELMEPGLRVEVRGRSEAVLLMYRNTSVSRLDGSIGAP